VELSKPGGGADGRKQCVYINKEDASSPTESLTGLMRTCVIDANKGRDVAIVDIPGTFLQTEQPVDEEVYVMLDGHMAELLDKIDPNTYQKYVHKYRGQSMIYIKLKKALYRTLKGAMLFWKKLTKLLTQDGFAINPYDWCVANKTVNGKQCTIAWHVDDLIISHMDPKVVTQVIAMLEKEYGKVADLTISRLRTC
jgi:hypothetical protein